ncbi:hypothetical protein CAFE_38810 [Caprobacter fermentans]|uniref:Transglutaminase-like domain-containing protein n=1 Tax=Caproicibacter fermentans TaxID=2576756 RepID=A0A6N8I4S2_9FIRM|nr:transglutaminase domain-containing protein [Caproicibacter fermentans]MVB13126.1 hypothetical protein [Caproicibacter fermentans]
MKLGRFDRKLTAALLAFALSIQLSGCAGSNLLSAADPSSSPAPLSSAASADSQQEKPRLPAVSSSVSKPSSSVSSAVQSSAPRKAKSESEVQTPQKVPESKASQTVKRLSIQNAASNGFTAVSQSGGYQALKTESERTLYKLIENSVYQVAVSKTYQNYAPTGQISIPGKLTEAEIRLTTTAYLDDHPQVFWVANAYSYGYRNDQTILQLYSELTQSECSAAVLAFNGKVQSILQSMPSGLGEFDREEYLFDYITKACSYDDSAVTNKNWKSYTAYGALIDGKAVCEGYSRAMLLLGGYAGLSGVLIRGTGEGVAHMWNGFKIDGNWYHVDLTWCDNTNTVYNYFNIDDKTLKLTHVIAPVASSLTEAQICSANAVYNMTLPVCGSTQDNYFRKKGIVISTLDGSEDDAVVSSVAAQMKQKKTTIAFLVTAAGYDATIKGLTTAKPYKMAAYLQEAASAAGVTLNLKNVSYVTDQADLGLNVFVSYR